MGQNTTNWLEKQKEHDFLIRKIGFPHWKQIQGDLNGKRQIQLFPSWVVIWHFTLLSQLPHVAIPILVRRLNHLNVRAEFIMLWSQGRLLPSCLRTNTIQSSLGGFCLECIKHKTCSSSALLLWKKPQFMTLHWAYLRTVFPNVDTCLGFSGGCAVWSIHLLFIVNSPFINTKN